MRRKFQEIWYEEYNIICINIFISSPKLYGRIAHETLRQQRQRGLGKRDRRPDTQSNRKWNYSQQYMESNGEFNYAINRWPLGLGFGSRGLFLE